MRIILECDIITKVTLDNNDLNYEYDALNRLESKNINDNLRVEYTYYNLGNKTSYLLHTLKIDTDTYEYIYDDLYNITKINLNNKVLNEYKYDINNQLILDNNYSNNITYKYTYDNYGNILSKSTYKLNTTTLINTDTYTYGNSNYKDQLTKFNNDTITYDNIGNPLKIGNTTYNWSNGRELQSISNTNLNVSYKYDRNGIRTKKILNNEEISYCLENSSIVIEKHKNYMLYFLRDDSNNLLGFTYQGDTYYYKKNAFDDIIGIYDSNYKEVCTYNYDSYGNILSIKDSTGKDITDTSNVAIINPFRYRSYYYDTETNLYYLNSRYYSPKMGRFINCDSILITTGSIISLNTYCYCVNNPANRIDSEGRFSFSFPSLSEIYESAKKHVSDTFNNTKQAVTSACGFVKNKISSGVNWIKNHVGCVNTNSSSETIFEGPGFNIPGTLGASSGINEKVSVGNISTGKEFNFNVDAGETDVSIGFTAAQIGVSLGFDVSNGIAISPGVSFGDYSASLSFGITSDLQKLYGMSFSKTTQVSETESVTYEVVATVSHGMFLGEALSLIKSSGLNLANNIIKNVGFAFAY